MKRLLKLLAAVFTVLTVAGIVKKGDSVYRNNPSERNPHEGKQVRFIEDPADPVNADGACGHLEDISDTEHNPTFYEANVKRIIDIILSFFGLILLSPVLIILSLWIVVDDPGPILFTQKRVGKDKQFFKLHKFRSMKMNTPHDNMISQHTCWIIQTSTSLMPVAL